MVKWMERRRIARVALSGPPTVRTHDGVAARLLDLSLHGARLAHPGILRPGARCLVHLPAELGALRLPAQILWCTILGAETGLDGERYLQAQSGLGFLTLTEPQRKGLAGLLQRVRSADPPRGECRPRPGVPARDYPAPCLQLPGETGRAASEPVAGIGRAGRLAY